MRIPYTEVAPGLFRPLVPVFVNGPSGVSLIDGLVDTGSDATLLPHKWATRLGIDVTRLPLGRAVQSATGQRVQCKATRLEFQLKRGRKHWICLTYVSVIHDAIVRPHWGFKGFLEYFRANFNGPKRTLTLTAGDNLPAAPSSP